MTKYQSKTSPKNSLFKSIILRWGCQQHLATLLLGSLCGVEKHLHVTGLGKTGAIFSEDILAAADRFMKHWRHFVVLMWNMYVVCGFPSYGSFPHFAM